MGYKKFAVESTAQAYIDLLSERGIDYFFANAGTDFAPLIDAFARQAASGRRSPQPVTVPHENAAVAMAHGNYLVTGKPQVVMTHVNVGTANAINGIINAARDHIPVLFTAGRTPLTEAGLPGSRDLYIHWAQEAFDQAGAVREYVKWDYELRNFTQLEAVIDRALEIAMAEPRGPVYLTLPREVLAESQSEFRISSPPRRDLGGPLVPDPDTIERAAEILYRAENPLIITSAVGRNHDAVKQLVALAESFAIPVVAFNPRTMCFPTTHPLHVGFNPRPFLETADVILVVDCDVPWYPSIKTPSADCRIIQMGIDPFYSRYPMRSFPCDLAVRADSAAGLPLLKEALEPFQTCFADKIGARFGLAQAKHDEQNAARRKVLEEAGEKSPLDPAWISHCIDTVKDDDTIIFNEYDLALDQVTFTQPGTYFGTTSAGGLGWGLGASIGAKMGLADKLVMAVLGDGAYMFGNPTPCHFVSRAMNLPTLTIIFNNGCWNAVRQANLHMYPEGWAARTGHFPLSDLRPTPRYEKIVAASDGYGERVAHPDEVIPALTRALQVVREEGRQAVLNMICGYPGN